MSRKILVGVSIVGHVVLFTGVFVRGVWDLDQLEYKHRSHAITAAIGPQANEGGSIDLPKQHMKPKETPRVVRETRQPRPPRDLKITIEPPRGTGDSTGPGAGPSIGARLDETPGTCTATDGSCELEKPPELPKLPEISKVVIKLPKIVTTKVLQQLRISGETGIRPSREVQQQMVRDDVMKTSGIIQVCVATDGAVSSVTLRKSTKYAAYDEALVSGARRWRYQPYSEGGEAVSVCGVVTFQYEMR